MKKYIKDNKKKTAKQIIIRKDGKQIINPTEEMILANGWVEYIAPVYEKTIEDYKRDKKDEILHFDSSEEVNIFYIQGLPVWLDKTTRAGLKLRFEAEIAVGKTLEEALEISRNDVAEELDGLPPIKMHCSNLAADGLQAAIENYNENNQ